MNAGAMAIVVVAGLLAIVSGWLVPVIFRSPRPHGLIGDLSVCTIATAILSYVEWVWILPALGFKPGWISVAAAIGDPLGFGWICLWLMRRIR
jgi:membrane associated rhomboid family serine protease